MTTEERLLAAGLTIPAEQMPNLVSAVEDIDRLVLSLRRPRPYTDEPLTTFRLTKAGL